ncbi:MAG: hypothetical protein U0T77_10195 [Chitinophagales bacterium]
MKFKLLIFSFIAVVIASFSVGCGKTDSVNECTDFPRNDTGSHAIKAGLLLIPGVSIHDSLQSTQVGNRIAIKSLALNMTIYGTQDATDCNLIKMDTFRIGSGPADTIKLFTSTLPIPDDTVRIWDVEAIGSGTVTPTGVTTDLKVIKAKSNITVGTFDLTTINASLDLHLIGTLKREILP